MTEFDPVFFEMQLEMERAPPPVRDSRCFSFSVSSEFCLKASIGSVASVDVIVFLAAEPYFVADLRCFAVIASNDYNIIMSYPDDPASFFFISIFCFL